MEAREYALYRVEDKDNSYLVNTFYEKKEAIKEAERLFKQQPQFCFEVEARVIIFSIKVLRENDSL